MAYSDFRDKLKKTREDAELTFKDNSEEAWSQIKKFFTDPTHWIAFGIALMLIIAGIFTIKFVSAIRAPALHTDEGPITLGESPEMPAPDELEDEIIDDSNTVQPMLTGARKEDYYTFLLIATDASSSNTDTLMIVSYDVKNQKLNLMSIPRDTMVNVSWDIKKINSVYGMSGLNGLKKHIGKLIGFIPDYYVKIDLEAFISVVDLIGGVDFDVPYAMNYDDPEQNLHIHFQPGMQHLDGQQAMEVVRWRKNNRTSTGRVAGYDDTGRIQTQQAFLKAALKQALSIRNWTKISGYVEIFNRDVESDLELGNMLWFARKAMDLSEDGFTTCTIPGDYYASAWSRSTQSMQSYVTLYPQQVVRLVNESFNPYLAQVSTANMDIMSILADGSVISSTGYVADSTAAQPPVLPGTEPEEPDALVGEGTDAIGGTTLPDGTVVPGGTGIPSETGTEPGGTTTSGGTGTHSGDTTAPGGTEQGEAAGGQPEPEPAPEPQPEPTQESEPQPEPEPQTENENTTPNGDE